MTPANWIAIVTVCVAICSWFVISALNRKNEIAKERMKFRLNILLSVLDSCDEVRRFIMTKGIDINDKELTLKFFDSLIRMQLFGSSSEISLCESIFQKFQAGKPVGEELNKLQDLIVKTLKRELAVRN